MSRTVDRCTTTGTVWSWQPPLPRGRQVAPHAWQGHGRGDQAHCAKCGQPRAHANHTQQNGATR